MTNETRAQNRKPTHVSFAYNWRADCGFVGSTMCAAAPFCCSACCCTRSCCVTPATHAYMSSAAVLALRAARMGDHVVTK